MPVKLTPSKPKSQTAIDFQESDAEYSPRNPDYKLGYKLYNKIVGKGAAPGSIPSTPSQGSRSIAWDLWTATCATTTIYAPFTSSYLNSSTSSWELQGIKINPFASRGKQVSYIMVGTTGSAISDGGVGAVYVGRIDGKSTSSGSGSGQWINFNVPFADATGTSAYGPDILSPGNGPGGIGKVALVGTWTKSGSSNIFGFYYKGSLDRLKTAPTDTTGFKTFQATTTAGNNALANYTYLHSVDGGYAVGNYSTKAGFINYGLNSGPDSGSYVYDPKRNTQINAVYKDGYKYHSLFGIWQNNNKTYTVSGGASDDTLLAKFANCPSTGQGQRFPLDAVLGKGMLADIDPVTGNVTNEKNIQLPEQSKQ